MKYAKTVFLGILIYSQFAFGSDFKFDLDKDGTQDEVIQTSHRDSTEGGENFIKKSVEIRFSASKKIFTNVLTSDSGFLDVRPGKKAGELIIDYTNRSSRESPELNYNVYQWSENLKTLCLYSSVSGLPPNQLKREIVSSDLSISLYDGCSSFERNEIAQKVVLVSSGLNDVKKIVDEYDDGQLPEWAALDLVARLSLSSLDYEIKVALAQNDSNIASAIIILRNIVKTFPNHPVARKALADISLVDDGKLRAGKIDQPALRCGWFEMSTPGNISLTDRDGKWAIETLGEHPTKGNLPKFDFGQWVTESNNYGYGCACLNVIVSEDYSKINSIIVSFAKPLSACRSDSKLIEPVAPHQ